MRIHFLCLSILFLVAGCDVTVVDEPGSPPASGGLCTNSCTYARDGDCDDGGPGSDYNLCSLGSDCADCGSRSSGSSGGSGGSGGGSSKGTMMVYSEYGSGGTLSVNIGSRRGTLTRHYTGTGTLACPTYQQGLTFVVELDPGTYSVSAQSEDGVSWAFTRRVVAGQCYGEKLVRTNTLASGGTVESRLVPMGQEGAKGGPGAPSWLLSRPIPTWTTSILRDVRQRPGAPSTL